jgi:tRNA(Ile)-lysidine synthase
MGPDPAVAAVRCAVRGTIADVSAGSLVVVASSGGTDSLALADATAFVARRAGVRVAGVVVDHGLHRGSAHIAVEAQSTLRLLGLDPVIVERVTVERAGAGLEAAARSARYAALAAAADSLRAVCVLLGHTRNDQAETVLLGLVRGSGARSLAGMASAAGRYRRPLLGLHRKVTERACHAAGLTPWQDPHNQDPAFARVRARHEALPELERVMGPGIIDGLARTAQLIRDDADLLDSFAEDAGRQCLGEDDTLAVAELAAIPIALRRRILLRWLSERGCPRGRLGFVHVSAVDALVMDWHGQGPVWLPGGVRVIRGYDRLKASRDSAATS